MQSDLPAKYKAVRQRSAQLIANLSAEDCQIQAMEDASPLKWHLAHTTWFFETFILLPHKNDYRAFDASFSHIFNSYYNAIGSQFKRAQRGLLSRPSLETVLQYRAYVDEHVQQLLQAPNQLQQLFELGLAHEQQHQELMLMDLLYHFSVNPSFVQYDAHWPQPKKAGEFKWLHCEAADVMIGTNPAHETFCFDNETPAHEVKVPAFCIANRLVTNGEYLDFINAGGYDDYTFWHSDGFAWLQQQGIASPLYWHFIDGQWYEYSLAGLRKLDLEAPLVHVSFYEAYAFSQFKQARLASEFEWEYAQKHHGEALEQSDDTAWQWTQSHYGAYPGFKPFAGNAGEYNGKFMVNQYVLRGGSGFTPEHHTRATYRNFFYPHQRWMCSAIRLAKDV